MCNPGRPSIVRVVDRVGPWRREPESLLEVTSRRQLSPRHPTTPVLQARYFSARDGCVIVPHIGTRSGEDCRGCTGAHAEAKNLAIVRSHQQELRHAGVNLLQIGGNFRAVRIRANGPLAWTARFRGRMDGRIEARFPAFLQRLPAVNYRGNTGSVPVLHPLMSAVL